MSSDGIVRCETCGNPKPEKYILVVKPTGAAICGNDRNPGLLFLNRQGAAAYKHGERIFTLDTGTVKIQAENPS
jgi:hypothetical protein